MMVVVSSYGGVIVHTLCFRGFFRVFVGGKLNKQRRRDVYLNSFLSMLRPQVVVVLLHTRTEVCCKTAEHAKMLVFTLKGKAMMIRCQ